MSIFDEIRQNIDDVQALSRLSENEASNLRGSYPDLPEDYLAFLSEVGYGDLGSFQLFSGPIAASEVYPSAPEALLSVLLFGDDFQGYCFGFDTADDFRLVEVDPRGNMDRTIESNFIDFLRGYFG